MCTDLDYKAGYDVYTSLIRPNNLHHISLGRCRHCMFITTFNKIATDSILTSERCTKWKIIIRY